MNRVPRVALALALALSCGANPPAADVHQMSLANPDLPGLKPDAPLVSALAAKASAMPDDYRPRTHHLNDDGSPVFTNRLINETSPYLLQHAHNPVNWYPWGDDAFERARVENKPVLLSVGYATCHWCHVMERESFEDLEIARYINTHFVPIKVDREERPDVDDVYMTAVHLLRGSGGWPMTVVMTPDRAPFFGGTYFPARDGDRGARQGFLSILTELATSYAEDPESAVREAKRVTEAIAARSTPRPLSGVPSPRAEWSTAVRLNSAYDPVWGGFSQQPKFPRPTTVEFLLRYWRRSGDPQSLAMAEHTLDRMAAGGMRDHIGGGFHRYSVDRRWLVPHFEKMLYDQGQLTVAYLEGWQATGREDFAEVARSTLAYVDREMSDDAGGFYSATDADSPTPDGHSEEGWFFTWTPEELTAVLGAKDGRTASVIWGVTAAGNFEGRSVLSTHRSISESAVALQTTPAALQADADRMRPLLYAARAKRPPPVLDDKVLTAWNGLMISAFARCGLAFSDEQLIARAARAARFVLENMRTDEGRLLRSYRAGNAHENAILDDYAYFIAALLDLFEATSDPSWLAHAVALQADQDAHFAEGEPGTQDSGYFLTADDGEALLTRSRPSYDGARPSGNSVSTLNNLRLEEFTSNQAYRTRAEGTIMSQGDLLDRAGHSVPKMASALDFLHDLPKQIVIVHDNDRASAAGLLAVLGETWLPNRVLVVVGQDDVVEFAKSVPLVQDKVSQGAATAYVCERGVCELPTTDPLVFAEQLAKVKPLLADESPPLLVAPR